MSNKQSSGRKRVLTIGGILLVVILLLQTFQGVDSERYRFTYFWIFVSDDSAVKIYCDNHF